MTRNDIDEIKAMALAYGACEKAVSIKSVLGAVALLMTPQGREFALKTGFPTYKVWKENADSLPRWVYLDAGKAIADSIDCVVVGATDLTFMADGPDHLRHVVAMHGAKVTVDARNHAVVTVTSIDSIVEISNDGTAIVTIEKGGGK